MEVNICLDNKISCMGYCNGRCVSTENCFAKNTFTDISKYFGTGKTVLGDNQEFFILQNGKIKREILDGYNVEGYTCCLRDLGFEYNSNLEKYYYLQENKNANH